MAHAIEITPIGTKSPATIPLSQIRYASAGERGKAVITLVDGTTIQAEEKYSDVSRDMIHNAMPFLSVENVA